MYLFNNSGSTSTLICTALWFPAPASRKHKRVKETSPLSFVNGSLAQMVPFRGMQLREGWTTMGRSSTWREQTMLAVRFLESSVWRRERPIFPGTLPNTRRRSTRYSDQLNLRTSPLLQENINKLNGNSYFQILVANPDLVTWSHGYFGYVPPLAVP